MPIQINEIYRFHIHDFKDNLSHRRPTIRGARLGEGSKNGTSNDGWIVVQRAALTISEISM